MLGSSGHSYQSVQSKGSPVSRQLGSQESQKQSHMQIGVCFLIGFLFPSLHLGQQVAGSHLLLPGGPVGQGAPVVKALVLTPVSNACSHNNSNHIQTRGLQPSSASSSHLHHTGQWLSTATCFLQLETTCGVFVDENCAWVIEEP